MINITKNITFSTHEYDSLRSEMISRIEIINSQSNLAITTILSTWTVGFAIIFAINEFEIKSYVLSLASVCIFLIPIFYFIPLSIKSGENIRQIASISAYIRVFYDYFSFKQKKEIFNWETSNNIYSYINVNRGKPSILMRLYNEEYVVLSITSLGLYISMSIFSLYHSLPDKVIEPYYTLFVIFLFIFAIVGIASIFVIQKASCMNNSMMKNTIFYVNAYIDRAIELNLLSKDNKQYILDFLDSFREHCE